MNAGTFVTAVDFVFMHSPEKPATITRAPSHLFYQSRLRRPLVDHTEGIILWDQNGNRFIDETSGAMVVNIGHGNRHVLETMKRQMDKVTFAYRLHFENEPAEDLARRIAGYMPDGMDKVFFVSGVAPRRWSPVSSSHANMQ